MTEPCGCRPGEGVYCDEAERLRSVWLGAIPNCIEQWYDIPEWRAYADHIRRARKEIAPRTCIGWIDENGIEHGSEDVFP